MGSLRFGAGIQTGLPIFLRRRRILPELIPLAIGQPCDSDRHEHGGNNENQNAAPEAPNDAVSRGGGLGIAQCTTLRITSRAQDQAREERADPANP